MEITKKVDANTVTYEIAGRLDTITAPTLEEELKALSGVTTLVLDCSKLDYVSSAGLRVLLSAQKRIKGQGELIITNVCEAVMDIFEVTGFTDILDIR